jgi:hypothetical protein
VRKPDGTDAAVELVVPDSVVLRTLAQPEMAHARWQSFLDVRVLPAGNARTPDLPPLSGSFRVVGDVVRFEPRFPLEPGMTYRAEFDPVRFHAVTQTLTQAGTVGADKPYGETKLVAVYSPPKKPAQPTTQVTAIYPSSDLLPENLLRFYIVFSAPMSRGEAYRRIRLLETTTRKPVEAPFLELNEELWSNDGTRFTLLFDPGRIKRGLRPREEVGPVLEAGKSYSLVIDREWPDAAGNALKVSVQKTFRVGPSDDSSPDPKVWAVLPPPAHTRNSLEVRFPEPLDRALLARLIAVHDANGRMVPGEVSVGENEKVWKFKPNAAWNEGAYRLVVGTELEDVAGNSVARPFEVDLTAPISRHVSAETVAVTFRIGPRTR